MERNLTYQNSGYAQYLTSEGTAPWGENILRYNISDNDGLEVAGSLSISGQGKIKVLLHNNIWINDTKPVIDFKSTAVDDTIRFYNNALQVRSTFLTTIYLPPSSSIQKKITGTPTLLYLTHLRNTP